MPNFQPASILCPLDLSEASAGVLRWAALLATAYHATLRILHAEWIDYPRYFLPSQEAELAAASVRARSAAVAALGSLVAEYLPARIPHQVAVVEGHPIETILEDARLHHPGLIVMGSHGRSGLARLRLGSVAENVVRLTTVPTLVVRAPQSGQAPATISRILCPVAMDEQPDPGMAVAAGLAATTGASLVALHVEEPGVSVPVHRDRLCAFVPDDVRTRCHVAEMVRQGNAAEQILLAARENQADLIVLAARHRRLLDFSVIGSTTEAVMRHADAAVFVLPASSLRK